MSPSENGEKCKPKATIVLPISAYEKLLDDLEDLAVIAGRRDESAIQHDQLVGELKRDGIL